MDDHFTEPLLSKGMDFIDEVFWQVSCFADFGLVDNILVVGCLSTKWIGRNKFFAKTHLLPENKYFYLLNI